MTTTNPTHYRITLGHAANQVTGHRRAGIRFMPGQPQEVALADLTPEQRADLELSASLGLLVLQEVTRSGSAPATETPRKGKAS